MRTLQLLRERDVICDQASLQPLEFPEQSEFIVINLSLQAVITLTEWSERTVRRRLADGTLKCAEGSGAYNKTLICFDSIRQDVCIPLAAENIELVKAADAGNAEAQTDLALLFFEHGKPKSAMYWLELAAKQNYPDAMQWLGDCYLRGAGVASDENLAVMWLAKAASLSHPIAMRQIEALGPRLKGGAVSLQKS